MQAWASMMSCHLELVSHIHGCIRLESCERGRTSLKARDSGCGLKCMAALQFAGTDVDNILFIERRIFVCVSCSFLRWREAVLAAYHNITSSQGHPSFVDPLQLWRIMFLFSASLYV